MQQNALIFLNRAGMANGNRSLVAMTDNPQVIPNASKKKTIKERIVIFSVY